MFQRIRMILFYIFLGITLPTNYFSALDLLMTQAYGVRPQWWPPMAFVADIALMILVAKIGVKKWGS